MRTAAQRFAPHATPNGNTTDSVPTQASVFEFTGRENDGDGLYYMRARYYAPSIARFISRDPAGLAGGLNLYAYAGDSPTNFTDPTGTLPEENRACGACPIYAAAQVGPGAYVGPGLGLLVNQGGLDHDVIPMYHGQNHGGLLLAQADIPPAKIGDRLYRLYGGGSRKLGRSWTSQDPRTMKNPAKELGLPKENAANRMTSGKLNNTEGVGTQPAAPIGNNPGGAPETVVPNPETQIDIDLDIPFEVLP